MILLLTRTTPGQGNRPNKPIPQREPIPMQLEKRQPGSIAELAARPVTIKLPPRNREQYDIVLVNDLIGRSGLGGPLRLEEKRGLALGDVFRSQGDGAFWGFEYSAWFFGGEGSRYSRLGVEGCCHGFAGLGDVGAFGIEVSGVMCW